MRLLLVVLLVGSLLQLAQAPVTAAPAQQTPAAQMTVRAGFDGFGKANGWLPIEVEVRNDGPDIDGEIQIVITDTSGSRSTYMRAPVVYSAPAVLPRRSHKRILMEGEMRVAGQKIQARLLEKGNVIAEQDVPLTRVPAGDLLCGVLSRSGPAFDFLPTLELPAPLRRARIAHIEVEDLPTRPQVLASLDCLIFDNITTTAMLDSQKAALTSWVYSGGLMVVIGGSSWQRTLSALPADLLPVKATGLVSLDSLDSLTDIGGEPIKDQGPWLVSQATLADGNTVVEQDGVPLISASRRGNGTVLYMAMDPTAEPLRSWAGTPRLWRYVLAHGSATVGVGTTGTSPFSGWGRYPRNAMVDVSMLNGPTPGLMMLALALFALIVGPLNYIFLARFGRPGWSVVTIPLLTGLAAVGTFTLASAYRDSDVIVNKVSIVRGYPDAPAYGRTYVSVLSRKQTTLAIRSGEASLMNSLYFPFPRDPAPDAQPWTLKIVEGMSPAIDEFPLQAGALGTLQVDSQVNLPGQLETDLRVDGRQIVGAITNRLDSTLYDAALIVDYQVLRLGDLRKGETREVSMTLTGNALAGFGPPNSFANQLYPASSASGRRVAEGARRDILESAFGTGFNAQRFDLVGPTLLGWIDTPAAPLEIVDARPATLETTLLVSSLPLTLPKGFEGELPPQVIQRRQLGTATLNRQQSGSYDLASGESIAFQFSLPSGSAKMLLDGLYVNIDGRLRGFPGAPPVLGEVSLYNWQKSEWEDRVVGFGRNLVRDVTPYVSAAGDIRVRYTFKPPPDTSATGVSFSRFDVTASGVMR
ncbi:MAG: hypothetical protein IT306_25080 [Chloroflexi bacterium]|nr:hypothetical protein [Chloroflexota bacterium]